MEAKKKERKRKRFAARLLNSKGIHCTDIPTTNIILCNAGQASGLEKADILMLLESIGLEITPPKFIAQKGETYSYVVFSNIEDAIQFYTVLNGVENSNEKVGVLYMNYVERVPNMEVVIQHENPKGLMLLNEFITVEEEEMFLKLFDWCSERGSLKNRQVKHYGYAFRYGSNDVDLSSPLADKIPKQCDMLWSRLEQQGYVLGVPDQLTVNQYSPGQGIPLHVDKHSPFGDTILSLSLGSDVVMDWRHHSGTYLPLLIPARSLLVMQDEARYAWQHGIQARAWDPVLEERAATDDPHAPPSNPLRVLTAERVPRRGRVSLTFRWTRTGVCGCAHPALCDSAPRPSAQDLEDTLAAKLEELHVHQVYEQIASHFSSTRRSPWPGVLRFMREVPSGSIVLDLGAGNGKNLVIRNDIVQIAGEHSGALSMECSHHIAVGRGSLVADCARLDVRRAPLRDAAADVVLCVAVLHHFSTQARRMQAISSIERLLRPGGRALITVWAKQQTGSNYLKGRQEPAEDTTESILTVAGVNLPLHENRTQFKHKDLLVPWKLRNRTDNKLSNKSESTLLRYYHVFDENELEELCTTAGFHVESGFYEEGNWCVVCTKIV